MIDKQASIFVKKDVEKILLPAMANGERLMRS